MVVALIVASKKIGFVMQAVALDVETALCSPPWERSAMMVTPALATAVELIVLS